MLDDGYTLDGAAGVLGWSSKLVGARAKILELPGTAQQLLGSGELPVSTVPTLTQSRSRTHRICVAVGPHLGPEPIGATFGETGVGVR
jgi:hypothetical protein